MKSVYFSTVKNIQENVA